MAKRCPYKNDDYRKHFAATRRAMVAPQHDYDGKGPIADNSYHPMRRRATQAELLRYAAALGRSRGQLPDNLSEFYAFDLRRDDGTAYVDFTPGRYVKGRYGPEFRKDADATPVRVELRFLDWKPEPPTEENLKEAA